MNDERIEQVAAVQHEIWIHWMRFLFSCGELRPDGSFLIPPEKVTRWQNQMERSYSELSDAEKASDRDQALKVMQVIEPAEPEAVTDLESDLESDLELEPAPEQLDEEED
jgi:hypothetical protein